MDLWSSANPNFGWAKSKDHSNENIALVDIIANRICEVDRKARFDLKSKISGMICSSSGRRRSVSNYWFLSGIAQLDWRVKAPWNVVNLLYICYISILPDCSSRFSLFNHSSTEVVFTWMFLACVFRPKPDWLNRDARQAKEESVLPAVWQHMIRLVCLRTKLHVCKLNSFIEGQPTGKQREWLIHTKVNKGVRSVEVRMIGVAALHQNLWREIKEVGIILLSTIFVW